ncbi:hypothetical protein OH797_15660 [Streptomyces anulatus]|uniref:hypothetical protein n=1 Tax=Streptomyces TaxID=1883 RepID=UPI000AE61B93|nr:MULTISPECIES: hypothetical protein [Streptomyces]MDF9805782.1 hypothetical protein [Streptomyces sp. HB372]WSR77688.1 hypothetical protein OG274_21765 [Streptomyces anulatus]WTC63938.1 hypothetical protein OG865_15930 [Streptomyces anulatus]WTC73032.1 hypothetical protein OG882_22995 [Streptomyces anulatus]WUC87453.1 hypothetical protein OHQ35_15630 [Streptomyces anulatus]
MDKRIKKFYALAGILGLFALGSLATTHGAVTETIAASQGSLAAPAPDGDSGHIDWP